MSVTIAKGQLDANTLQWTEGAVTLAVTSGGSDTATRSRPARLTAGDYSASPFLTMQAALDALPKGLNHAVNITVGAGSFAGFTAGGFVGKGLFTVTGSTAIATITSGYTSGTANTGTTSTTMNKPAGGSDWTADDLRGTFLVITSGGGSSGEAAFPTIRPILSNTTTSLTVDAIVGMDNTSVFQIVDIATIFNTNVDCGIDGVLARAAFVTNEASIRVYGLQVDETSGNFGYMAWRCKNIILSGAYLAGSSGIAGGVFNCTEGYINSVIITGLVLPYSSQIASCVYVNMSGAGKIDAQYCVRMNVYADADGCTGNAVRIRDILNAQVGLNANNCTATPLICENINSFQIDGQLTGANSGTSYGASFSRGGQYSVAGADIAGSSFYEFLIEGREGKWSQLSDPDIAGTYASRGTHMHWGAGYTVYQTKLRIAGGVGLDAFDELVTNNMVIGGIVKHYGPWQSLNPAYKEITAFAGGGQSSATVVGYRDTQVVLCVSDYDSIRLLDPAVDVSYAGGLIGTVGNISAGIVNVYPPSGYNIFLSGITDYGTDNPISLNPGEYLTWLARSDLSYSVWKTVTTGTGPGSFTSGSFTAGITVTQSNTNTPATDSTGNGTGVGVLGTGGATNAAGVSGVGGAPNGKGVIGLGSGTGAGVFGTGGPSSGTGTGGLGGAPNGYGGVFTGRGSGAGVAGQASGSGPGVYGAASNGGSGIGGEFYAGANAPATGVYAFCGVAGQWAMRADGASAGAGGLYSSATVTGSAIRGEQLESGYAGEFLGDTTSPVKALMHFEPTNADPSGASVVGDMVTRTTSGLWRICTTAGTPGTWENLIKGTVGATDNRLVRSDGTGTGTVQSTGMTVTDTDGVDWTASGTNESALTVTGSGSGKGVTATGGGTSGTGVNGTGGAPNGVGVNGQGTGTGAGVTGTGGATGNGGTFTGGATGGQGVSATGTGTGDGIAGQGGPTGGSGGTFTGAGSGRGVNGTGGSSAGAGGAFNGGTGGDGIQATGNGTGPGVRATGGSGGHGILATGGSTGNGGNFTGGPNTPSIVSLGVGNGAGVFTTGGSSGNGITAAAGGGTATGGTFTGGTGGVSGGNGITTTGGAAAAFTSGTGITATGGAGTTVTGGAGVNGAGGTASTGTAGNGGTFTGGTVSGAGIGGYGVLATGSSATSGTPGVGVRGVGGASNGNGVEGQGTGTGIGGKFTATGGGYALSVHGDTTSAVAPTVHLDPTDTDPSGAGALGDLIVKTTTGVWRVCTTAGTPGTFENLIKGTTGATDNQLLRSDGTGTATLQASGITIDDANGISGHTEVQNIQSGTTYTMAASDTGKVVIFTSGSPVTVTIPQTLTAGWHCRWEQQGAGQISFNGTAVTAATLNNRQSQVKSAGQYAVGGLACYTSGTPAVVTLFGDTGT